MSLTPEKIKALRQEIHANNINNTDAATIMVDAFGLIEQLRCKISDQQAQLMACQLEARTAKAKAKELQAASQCHTCGLICSPVVYWCVACKVVLN